MLIAASKATFAMQPEHSLVKEAAAKATKKSTELAKYVGPYDFNEKDFREQVSLIDYAHLGAILGSLPPYVTIDVARRSISRLANPRHFSLREEAFDSAATHISMRCNWPQLRRLCPVRPLREELRLAHYSGLPHYNYYFGGEAYSARWLVEKPNRQPSDPVILYLHGGSYALKVQRPQLKYLVNLYKELLPQQQVSILVLDYTIGPFAKYPTQLNEGMACYNELKKSCNNIIFYGDSAGGHLGLTMLLKGAHCDAFVLVSPSTDMTSGLRDDTSMREVFVDTQMIRYDDPLISPLFADPKVWETKLPKDTAIVWGGAEPCKQQMIDFANVAHIERRFEEPGGSHDCMLRGNTNPGSAYIRNFLREYLEPKTDTESAGSTTSLAVTVNSSKKSSRSSFLFSGGRAKSKANDLEVPSDTQLETPKLSRSRSIINLWRKSKI